MFDKPCVEIEGRMSYGRLSFICDFNFFVKSVYFILAPDCETLLTVMCFDSDECNLSFVVCIVYSSANMNVHYQNQQVTYKRLG
jgi:hypothetical protein